MKDLPYEVAHEVVKLRNLNRELTYRNNELRKELTEAQNRVRFWRNKANAAILDRES